MPGPIATLGSMHACPMCSGTVPHVGGPISGPGTPNILINNKPASIMGDMCVCVGPPDVVVQGEASIFFNGTPVVCIGHLTAHGGAITSGEANVIASTAAPSPSVTMPLSQIPFPKITVINKILGNTREAQENQEKVKEEAKKHGYLSDFNLSV